MGVRLSADFRFFFWGGWRQGTEKTTSIDDKEEEEAETEIATAIGQLVHINMDAVSMTSPW